MQSLTQVCLYTFDESGSHVCIHVQVFECLKGSAVDCSRPAKDEGVSFGVPSCSLDGLLCTVMLGALVLCRILVPCVSGNAYLH